MFVSAVVSALQWYVGQEAPNRHQVYFYHKTTSAERAFDAQLAKAGATHKIQPMSRSRSLLWVMTPVILLGLWGFNAFVMNKRNRGQSEDPFAKFRKEKRGAKAA